MELTMEKQSNIEPKQIQEQHLSIVGSLIKIISIQIEGLSAGYGHGNILNNVNMNIFEKHITAIIGPSGCGKSTLIRCLNRMHEVNPGCFL